MPFTFSHPAIILPLLNKRFKIFSATGLVIGSIAPDFESFVRLNEKKIYGHTWTGIFWFDLPVAIIICMLFHLIVREPLIENLPLPLEERFDQYKNFKWLTYFKEHFLIVIFSLLIGITSHLLWDALTHLNLQDPDSTKSMLMYGHTRVYIILQYSLSLIGLLAVAIFIYKMPRKNIQKTNSSRFKYWLFVTLLSIFIGVCLETFITYEHDIQGYMSGLALFLINISISSFLSSLIIVSLFYKVFLKERE